MEKEGVMMKIGKIHHRLAYAAAAVAVLSVIFAGIAWLAGSILGITATSYISLATIAILFAIYFLIEGAASAAKKG